MTVYTASHWGIYEVEPSDCGPRLKPFAGDPNPSPIGLHQLDDELMRLRVRHPAVRQSWLQKGPGANSQRRGREPFVQVEWDRALDLVAAEIERVRRNFGNQAIFGGSYGWGSAGRFHHTQSQIHRFLNTVGGYVRHKSNYSFGAATVLLPHIIAPMEELITIHTSWDVIADHTRLLVSFGGVPSKNAQVSQGLVSEHRIPAALERIAQAGVRLVNVSPVQDNLPSNGQVEWIPIRPNTDTALMLGMAWVLQDEGLMDRRFVDRYTVGFEAFEHYLSGQTDSLIKDPRWAESITGIPAERIAALARDMAATRTMINASWALQRAAHGEQPYWTLITLAAMLGQIGLPGGGFGLGYGMMNQMGSQHPRLKGPTLPQGQNAVEAFIPAPRISDMLLNPGKAFTFDGAIHHYPDIRLVCWAGGNPFHHHQDLNRLVSAWQRPETIVVNEQFWSPMAKFADIVLPATTTMEREDIGYANQEGCLVAMRKILAPVGEARSDYEIFTGLARRLNAEQAFTEGLDEKGWLRRLYEEFRSQAGVDVPDFDRFWQSGIANLSTHDGSVVMLQNFRADPDQHRLATPSGRIEIGSAEIASFGIADCPGHPCWQEPPEWLGAAVASRYPLHLLSDQPMRRLHSQLDASAHSRAGKIRGREPIFLNRHDAAARGIADGDIVEVYNSRGRCLAGAILTDVLMPGVVRLSTGAWFDPDWETGLEKHGNPNVLTLDKAASGLSQSCIAQTCLVEVRVAQGEIPDVTAFELPEFVADL